MNFKATRFFSAFLLSIGLHQSASATGQPAPNVSSPWRAMAEIDLAFMAQWAKQEHINAVYPQPSAFQAILKDAQNIAEREVPLVRNFTGYRQILNHFANTFNDAHFYVHLTLSPTNIQWPGFSAVYRDGRFETVDAAPDMQGGQIISECDGQSLTKWVASLARYETVEAGLESTRALIAPLIFRDVSSPFVTRPKSCVIGAKEVRLEWRPINLQKYNAILDGRRGENDPIDRIEAFGADGAWITLENFNPRTFEEAQALRKVYRDVPFLRSMRLIVIDERNNGGGPYEWFMGFIRALYGENYTNFYARARLQIANVYRVTPETLKSSNDTPDNSISAPPDGVDFDPNNTLMASALAKGDPVLRSPANARQIALPKNVPINPVKAKVIVLTGYGCYSACIGFVDEMKRIPGVIQAGVDTNVDSRTGTPFAGPLPSGNGLVMVPVMTRNGRQRGDNVPQKPTVVFSGDIQNTGALKVWIANTF